PPPRADRSGLDADDRNRPRLQDEQRDRCDVVAHETAASRLDPPTEGDERSLERSGQPVGEHERKLAPVCIVERPYLNAIEEDFLVEPDGDGSAADVPVRRPAQEAFLADELGRN